MINMRKFFSKTKYTIRSLKASAAIVISAEILLSVFSVCFMSGAVYPIYKHEGGELITPRRTYKYISYDSTDNGDGTYSAPLYTIKNKANEEIHEQIIKSGDSPEPVPIPPNKPGQKFYGWYVVDDPVEQNGSVTYRWGSNPTRVDHSVVMTFDDTADSTVYLAPVYTDYYFISFHEREEGAPTGSENILTRRFIAFGNSNTTTVKISDVRAPSYDVHEIVFYGWSYDGQNYITVNSDGTENETYITVNKSDSDGGEIDIYPVFEKARWINFDVNDDGDGTAEPVRSQFVIVGQNGGEVTRLTPSTRNGYSFLGWYTNAVGGTQITGSDGRVVSGSADLGESGRLENGKYIINNNTTLYAHWQANQRSAYTVIYWKQKVSDSKNASQKTYDYDGSEKRTDTTFKDLGTTNFNNKSYTGFQYSRTEIISNNNDNLIAPDGSTIVNVYYDRKLITMNFYRYTSDYTYTVTTSNSGTQYGFNGTDFFKIERKSSGTGYVWKTYEYTATNDNGNSLYGIVDGEYVKLQAISSGWIFKTWNYYYNNEEYRGQRYKQNSAVNYTNKRYYKSNLTFIEASEDNVDGTFYSEVDPNGGRSVLTRSTETIYKWYDTGGNEYTGTRYTRSNYSSSDWHLYKQFTGLYGQTLESNGYSWDTDYNWYDSKGSSGNAEGTRITFLDAFFPPENTTTLNYYADSVSGSIPIRFYKESETAGDYNLANEVLASSGNFSITDKYNGFTADSYSTDNVNWIKLGEKDSDGYYAKVSYTDQLHIRFRRNNKYTFSLDSNGGNLNGSTSDQVYTDIPYDAEIGGYVTNINTPTRAHYVFTGWYEDKNGVELYDFNSRMPDSNVKVYAGWRLEEFTVTIDPDGAELDRVSYTVKYGEKVSEIAELSKQYRPDSSGGYTYVYITSDKLPQEKRKSFYIPYDSTQESYRTYYNNNYSQYADSGFTEQIFLDCIDKKRYKQIDVTDENTYTLLGWYDVMPGGSSSVNPHNFTDIIQSDVHIRASWRLDGKYYVAYDPVMKGLSVMTEPMPQTIDPASAADVQNPGRYRDQSKVVVLNAPTITGADAQIYKFAGWRIVDTEGNPLEGDKVYDPGDLLTIQSRYAQDNEQAYTKCIHLQAYYVPKDSDNRRLSIVSLSLDANGGTINAQKLPTDPKIKTEGDVLTLTKQPNNVGVALSTYRQSFDHPGGYFLLGWDSKRAADNYIPEYYADGTIGADKLQPSGNTLYAVWEPMLYISFENHSKERVTFSASFTNYSGTMQKYSGTINEVTGEYDREPYQLPQSISIEPNRKLKLILPQGDENVRYTVTGSYDGGEDVFTVTNTGGDGAVVRKSDTSKTYSVTGNMKYDKDGQKICFYDDEIIVPPPTDTGGDSTPFVIMFMCAAAVTAVSVVTRRRRKHRERSTTI